MRSMTGFGKSEKEFNGKTISVEIKTLNSKQSDIYIKSPYYYREKEFEIRALLNNKLERGKIDLTVFISNDDNTSDYTFNRQLAKKYYTEIKEFSTEINEENDLLPVIMKMPDVLKKQSEGINEEEWKIVLSAIDEAVSGIEHFRMDEGKILAKDILFRIQSILALLEEIEPFEKARISTIGERIRKNVKQHLTDEKINQDRFEQELIFYIEKLDITEEKVRLKKHCDYFIQTMNEVSSGRKLGFICQEIGREINTIGSKANEVNMQKIVVMMKDELEKVKEQLGNIL